MGTVPLVRGINDPRNLLTLATLVVIATLCLYGLSEKSQKSLIVALAFVIFPYLPASNLFFPVGFVVAERVLYLPSMGFCMLVGYGACTLTRTGSKLVKPVVVLGLTLLLLVHSTRTVLRNQDWHSDMSLFRSAIHDNPYNGKVYNNLGHEMERNENYTLAERLFRRASEIQPDDVGAFINLGRILKQQERYEEAEKVCVCMSMNVTVCVCVCVCACVCVCVCVCVCMCACVCVYISDYSNIFVSLSQAYQQAIKLMPTGKSFRVAPSHINVYYNLANLIKADPLRLQEAYNLYQTALSMKPDFIEAHLNKGDVLLKLNRTHDAISSFERALQYNPEYADALFNLGSAHMQLGERTEAERSYRQALAVDGRHYYSMLSLALVLKEDRAKRRKEEAMAL